MTLASEFYNGECPSLTTDQLGDVYPGFYVTSDSAGETILGKV